MILSVGSEYRFLSDRLLDAEIQQWRNYVEEGNIETKHLDELRNCANELVSLKDKFSKIVKD